MTTYTITVYDQAGEHTRGLADGIQNAARLAQLYRRSYHGKVVVVSNQDNVDLGCSDGLTEEERADGTVINHEPELQLIESDLSEARKHIDACVLNDAHKYGPMCVSAPTQALIALADSVQGILKVLREGSGG